MKKSLLLFFVLIFLLSFASSKIVDYKESIIVTRYYERPNEVVTYKFYAEYDNKERYSTYDYRHGYSYRTSKEYWEKNHNIEWKRIKERNYNMVRDNKNKNYYLKYNPYSESYKKIRCYNSPPKGKLFYFPCPS